MNLLERFLIMTSTKAPINKEERDAIYVRMKTAGYLTEDELREMVKEEFKNVL